MRLAVLDIGSNTVNLLVADDERGGPLPVHTWKLDAVQICPWGLREGIQLRELEARRPDLGNAAWVPWCAPEDDTGAGPRLVAI
jgi:exopolyphosphatase/pppGpp-phosphohydrolase